MKTRFGTVIDPVLSRLRVAADFERRALLVQPDSKGRWSKVKIKEKSNLVIKAVEVFNEAIAIEGFTSMDGMAVVIGYAGEGEIETGFY